MLCFRTVDTCTAPCWEMNTLPTPVLFDLHCRLFCNIAFSKQYCKYMCSVRTDWNVMKMHCCVILPEQKCCQLVFFLSVNFSSRAQLLSNSHLSLAEICVDQFYRGSYSAPRTTLRPTRLAMGCSKEGYIVSWGLKDWVIAFICGRRKRRKRKWRWKWVTDWNSPPVPVHFHLQITQPGLGTQ